MLDNVIRGPARTCAVSETGNGVSLWNAPGAVVRRQRRSPMAATASSHDHQPQRPLPRQPLRRTCVSPSTTCTPTTAKSAGNVSIGNHVGYAIMFSSNLEITGNRADGASRSRAAAAVCQRLADRGQRVVGGGARARAPLAKSERRTSEKCVFIYNTNKNNFREQLVRGLRDRHPLHRRLGTQQHHGNAFIANRTQVKYVGTRLQDWSQGPRQLLERQPGLRPERRRHRGRGLPAQRPDRPGDLDHTAGQGC